MSIPTPLRSYVNHRSEVQVSGATVGQVIQSLLAQFPSLRPHLTNSTGELRPFVNLFLGEVNIKDLDGLDTPLRSDEVIRLVPAIAGG
jgi:molybdopterin converting factor small subunit